MGVSILLPTLCCEIYALATQHATLFQTVFLFAAHFADLTTGKANSDISRRLKAIQPKVQAALVSGKFDDGHIIAVFLLAALYHFGGNMNASAAHLQGLSLMLSRNRQQRLRRGQDTPPEPIISIIQRQCIRFYNQLRCFQQKLLEIQPTVDTNEWDTSWSYLIPDKMAVQGLEATFTFQDYQFSILQLSHRASKLRKSESYSVFPDETLIALEVHLLTERIKEFQNDLKIRARGPTWYPRKPLQIDLDRFPGTEAVEGLTEPIYGYILITTYHLIISLTLISQPGLETVCPERIEAATELCRIYAVLQVDPPECFDLPLLTSLFSAGMSFNPISSPDRTSLTLVELTVEYSWIHQRFDRILWRYPNAKRVQKKLDEMWIHQCPSRDVDLSWYEDRRYAGTCEWTAPVC